MEKSTPTLLTPENYSIRRKEILDQVIKFGAPGFEIISGKRNVRVEPLISDTSYPRDLSGELTSLGEKLFFADITDHKADLKVDIVNRDLLLSFFMETFSLTSKTKLESKKSKTVVHIGPPPSTSIVVGYSDAKLVKDTFRIFQLLDETHLHGTSRMHQQQLVDLIKCSQSSTHEAYLSDFSDKSVPVIAAFESPIHSGYISIDSLLRCFYLNGLNQVFFARQLNRAHEELPNATCAELMELNQAHALESWDREMMDSTSFQSQALVSSSLSSLSTGIPGQGGVPKSGPGSAVGPFDLSLSQCRLACSHCWKKGFARLDHQLVNCNYAQRVKASGGSTSKSVALVADAGASTAIVVSESDADRVKRFEGGFAEYAAAKLRVDPASNVHGLFGLVASILDMSVLSCAFVSSFLLSPFYWDNAASVSLVNQLKLLSSVVPITPFAVGGVGSGVIATHSGLLAFLPPPFNLCYFASNSSVCLLSLGMVARLGGSYASQGTTLVIRDGVGVILDSCPLLPNNLSPVSLRLLNELSSEPSPPSACLSRSPVHSAGIPSLLRCKYFSMGRCMFGSSCRFSHISDSLDGVSSASSIGVVSTSVPSAGYPAFLSSAKRHYSAEQRARCDSAEDLHQNQGIHASDDILCEAVTNGEHSWSGVTAQDIRLNRILRGRCPQCEAAKMRDKDMHDSPHEPATQPGGVLWMDLSKLDVKSVGGGFVSLRVTDEFTGELFEWTSSSSKAVDLHATIVKYIAIHYTAFRFSVSKIVGDPDPSFAPLVASLGLCGIVLRFCSPGQHAKRIESIIGHTDARCRAVVAGLPFYVPKNLKPYERQWIADNQNDLPNARSRPSTPFVLRTGCRRMRNFKHPGLGLFTVCMVREFPIKRRAQALANETFPLAGDRAEIGVLVGHSALVPGSYDFLLANGEIVPREVVSPVQVHPFDWKRRTVFKAELVPPSVLPDPNYDAYDVSEEVNLSVSPADIAVASDPNHSIATLQSILPSRLTSISHVVPSPSIPSSVPAFVPSSVISTPPADPTPTPTAPLSTVISSGSSIAGASDSVSSGVPPRVSSRGAAKPPGFWSNLAAVVSCHACMSIGSRCIFHQIVATVGPVVARSAIPSVSLPVALGSPVRSQCSCRDAARRCVSCRIFDVVSPIHSRAALVSSIASSSEWRLVHTRGRSSPTLAPVLPTVSAPSSVLIPAPASDPVLVVAVRRSKYGATRRSRGHRSTTVIPIDTSLSSDDLGLIDSYITADAVAAANGLAALIAIQTESFDTQRIDEFDIDEAISFYAGTGDSDAVAFLGSVSPELSLLGCVAACDLRPVASTKCKEVPLSKALRDVNYEKLVRTTAAEILKQQRIGCLGSDIFEFGELPPDCALVRAHALYKDKADGRETCRIAAMGNLLPVDPLAVSFASVASDDHKMFSLAIMQAHCQSRSEKMNVRDFDIVGGFLRIKRDSPIRMFILFPPNLPHSLAGKYVEVLGALYGLRESNRLFSLEVSRVVIAAGFVSCTDSSPMTFVAFHPDDKGLKCIVNTHVDDFRSKDNCSMLTDRLHEALVDRFEEVTTNDPSTSFAGVSLVQHSNGACEVHQGPYFERVGSSVGIVHLSPIDYPCDADIFKRSVTAADCTSVDHLLYCSLTGHLIQTLKTRDEHRAYVSHLCSRNSSPDVGDYNKAIHLLRYLYSTRFVGRVFSSSSTELFAFCDAAFGNHWNGTSSEACFLSIGLNNAPFTSRAKSQSDVATNPMTAEYMSANSVCQSVELYRRFSAELGWPVLAATRVKIDNSTARSLAKAPEVTKGALHLHVKHHYIRQLISRDIVGLDLVASADMRADILTKYFRRPTFIRLRDILLNRASLP